MFLESDRSPAQIAASRESEETLPGLVHFARNGAGDSYSWYLAWQDSATEPPVLFCPHDSTVAEYFAPDVARCFERLWLRHGAWCENDPREVVLADLRAWLEILRPHLDESRTNVLQRLAEGATPQEFRTAESELV